MNKGLNSLPLDLNNIKLFQTVPGSLDVLVPALHFYLVFIG